MMKTYFAIVISSFVFGLPTAHAKIETVFPALLGRSSIDQSDQVATGYEMMGRIWKTATTVQEKSVDGWYEGRCYFRDRPNQPVAAMLVVSAQESNLHGNLKGLMSRKSIVQVMDRDARATAFQQPSPKISQQIESLAKREQKNSSFAYESQGADFGLVSDFFENDTRESFRLTLRRSGSRIYSTTTCTNTNGYGTCYDQSRPGRMLHVSDNGESAQYCYYFRRVKRAR